MDNFLPLAELIGFKGINTDFIEEMLPSPDSPLYLTDGDNILIRNGKIEKLPGVGYLNDISSKRGVGSERRLIGLPIYEKYDLTKRLLAFTPTQLEYLSGNSAFSVVGAMEGTADSVLSYATIDDKAVFTLSDEAKVRYWDGTFYGELVSSATLKARYLLPFQTFLVLMRPLQFVDNAWVERYQEIWPSYPGDIDTFQEEDRLMITAAGAINGGRALGDSIIVYFPKSMHRAYVVSETEGFGIEPVSEDIGLLAPRTLTGSKDSHFFLAKEGMMRYGLGALPVPFSWQRFNKLIVDGIDPLYYHKAIARYFDDTGLLYIAFPPAGSGDNGTLLIYSVMDNELVGKKTLTGLNYSAFGVFEKDLTGMTPDERRNYGVGGIPIIGTSDGDVLEQKYAAYQQINDPYESSITLPPVFFGDRHKNKRLMQADLLVEKQTNEDIVFNLEISNEANVTTVTPYTVTGDGNAGIRRYPVYVDVFGKEFRPVLKDSLNSYGFKLHGIVFRGYLTTQK